MILLIAFILGALAGIVLMSMLFISKESEG